MALLAALLRNEADRNALRQSTVEHELAWASSWRDLNRLVRRRPVAAAVADLNAEPRKDGVLRVYRFGRRYPHTPLVVWGELDGRSLYRLGKAGAADVLPATQVEDEVLVREVIEGVIDPTLERGVLERLSERRVERENIDFARFALHSVTRQAQVPDLADALDASVSTLERRCEKWGLPTPGRLLLWMRILHGLRWLREPGRSVESVAAQLGYSSGAAFRRAIRVTVGGRPAPWREENGLEDALDLFATECGPETSPRAPELEA